MTALDENKNSSKGEDAPYNAVLDANIRANLSVGDDANKAPNAIADPNMQKTPLSKRVKYIAIIIPSIIFSVFMFFAPNYLFPTQSNSLDNISFWVRIVGLIGMLFAMTGAFIAVYTEVEEKYNRHWKSVGAILRYIATVIAFGVLYAITLQLP